MFMKEFLGWVNWNGKTYPKYEQSHSIGYSSELNKKLKVLGGDGACL